MATATYDLIASQTLGSAAASITFSSIPSTYTDLRLVLTATATTSSGNVFLVLNGDSSALYSRTFILGQGTSATSSQATGQPNFNLISNNGMIATYPSLYSVDMFSYTGSTYKTVLYSSSEDENSGNANSSVSRAVGLYRSTNAITSLTLSTDTGINFAIGTTAQLYGIKSA